jgi:N-acetyl sugar amidotransferase
MHNSQRECNRCLYTTNHPFGLILNNDICSGCSYHDEKNIIDWSVRKERLKSIIREYRSKVGNYDCIVPITGGQDSFYTLHLVVNELKLRPLIVNFNRNFNSKIGLANMAQLRSTFDVDFQQFAPNPDLTRRVMRTTLKHLGTINWFWIAGQTSFPLRVARERKVPLIIWGAHQGNEQVGMFSHLDEVEMTKRYRRDFDLMGVDEIEITKFGGEFRQEELDCLTYPTDNEIAGIGIRGIYLGNYFRWDPVEQHKYVSKTYGYMGQKVRRTYYRYDNPDCNFYNDVQDILKFIKVGYSKVTDQLVREIRHERISKSRAQNLQKRYQNYPPERLAEFTNWLGASTESLDLIKLVHGSEFYSAVLQNTWRGNKRDSGIALRFSNCLSSQENRSVKRLSTDIENSEFGKGLYGYR